MIYKISNVTDTGISGNVLINEEADRLNSYHIWNYDEGHDCYYASMLVDLTQSPEKVRDYSFKFPKRNVAVAS